MRSTVKIGQALTPTGKMAPGSCSRGQGLGSEPYLPNSAKSNLHSTPEALTPVGSQMEITTEALTATAFSPFGEVIEHVGVQRRLDFSMPFQPTRVPTEPALWINSMPAHQASRLRIEVMERHPYSAQTFVPMSTSRCLVVVALPGTDGSPDLRSLRAFVTRGDQGFSYRPGIWHHALTSLAQASKVVVVMGYTGMRNDTELRTLAQDVVVVDCLKGLPAWRSAGCLGGW